MVSSIFVLLHFAYPPERYTSIWHNNNMAQQIVHIDKYTNIGFLDDEDDDDEW